jgi:saccharopine dehydrogenase-like NADP-dependent oxidoreductase
MVSSTSTAIPAKPARWRAGQVDALADLEHFSLDGVEYEAFNTSGGLGSLCETLAGKVRNLDYKSVRYPGHQQRMKFLLGDLGLRHDQSCSRTSCARACRPPCRTWCWCSSP